MSRSVPGQEMAILSTKLQKISQQWPLNAVTCPHSVLILSSFDSFFIFLKRPHRELQFEFHIEYLMMILKFDPSDLLKILVKLLKTAKNDQN